MAKKSNMDMRIIEEKIFKALMLFSLGTVMAALLVIVGVVFIKGIASLTVDIVTKTPEAGYYLGGGGGILNAIMGSLYLAGGATIMAFFASIAVAAYLQSDFSDKGMAETIRTVLDILWGVPSIIYGVFCFTFMVYLGIGTSLLAGMIALTMLEIPIMTRSMDEALRAVPKDMKEASYSLGATRTETALLVARGQALPGMMSGVLLALGRGIGDAASILFTAGFSDHVPTSLMDSAAALPTMIFFLSTSPVGEVRDRAYAAAFILLAVVLILSIGSKLLSRRFSRNVVK